MSKVIRTFTGQMINIESPETRSIKIEDIAHALSNIPRYNGQYYRFLSVAEHSLNVLKKVLDINPKATPKQQLHALLHDASEAYICDLPRPIKNGFKAYYEYEQNMMDVILGKWGIEEHEYAAEVEEADNRVFEVEWSKWIHQEDGIHIADKYRSKGEIKREFLDTFHNLVRQL